MNGGEQQLFVITMVEKQKRSRHRYNIFINDEYAFSVHEDIMIKHRLLKGETIHPEQTASILEDEERNQAYMKALRMIGRRPHSTSEVKRKLKEQGIEQAVIEWTCELLKKQNYINDEEFAKMWTEHRIYSQKKGRNLVRQELQQKGVSKELVKDAMEAIDPDEELQGALKLGQNKWKQTSGTVLDRKRKTGAYLLRRGFTNSIVSKTLAVLSQNHHEEGAEEEEYAEWEEDI